MKTALYRHYDASGRLLYVGITNKVDGRTRQHMADASWRDSAVRMDAEFFPTRDDALVAEWEAIRDENPLHNIRRSEPFKPKPVPVQRDPKQAALAKYMKANGLTQAQMAEKIGITQGVLSRFLSGKAQPMLVTACHIEVVTGGAVPPQSWVAPQYRFGVIPEGIA